MLPRWILGVALLAGAATVASCGAGTDAPTSPASAGATGGLSLSLDPSVVRLSPGGSTVSIATIRGAAGAVTATVGGVPPGVSVRVASATITAGVQTTKYIVFADAAAMPGTFFLAVHVVAPGGETHDAQLTLVITATS